MGQLMIFTRDKETAANLQKEGFILINKNNEGWTFMTNGNHAEKLSERDLKKVAITNKLCL